MDAMTTPDLSPASAETRARLEQFVDEARRRITTAYRAHGGHVYTEEPERVEDILRDVLLRAERAPCQACEKLRDIIADSARALLDGPVDPELSASEYLQQAVHEAPRLRAALASVQRAQAEQRQRMEKVRDLLGDLSLPFNVRVGTGFEALDAYLAQSPAPEER
jgi:hypothetical protein